MSQETSKADRKGKYNTVEIKVKNITVEIKVKDIAEATIGNLMVLVSSLVSFGLAIKLNIRQDNI